MTEILNAIMGRPDYQEIKHIPMGAIPAGSGNSLTGDIFSKSNLKIHFHNAIYVIIKAKSIDIGVVRCELM